jgi:hypothetical protein
MSRAGHSNCQGGLSAVQTQREDDHDRSFRKQPPTVSVRPFVMLQDWPHERAVAREEAACDSRLRFVPRTLISVRGQLPTRDL